MQHFQEHKTPGESCVTMTQMVLPQDTNALGTVFGGTVMSWMDIAAAIAATRHARTIVVTASVDALHFLAPIQLGQFVEIKAMVNFAASKSMEVGVRVEAENPLTGERRHTSSAYFTFVALNEFGKPTKIAPIQPQSDREQQRFEKAQIRHAEQMAFAQSLKRKYQNEQHPK